MKKCLIFSMLIYSISAISGEYTGKSKVTWMSSIVGDHFAISGNWVNRLNCSNMEQNIWYIYSETGSMDELNSMYSMAMAAYMSGKTIELYTYACNNSNGRPRARSIYLPSRSGQ